MIFTTHGVDLSSTIPMTLCQNINLLPNQKYSIKYSLYVPAQFSNIILTGYINNVNITSLYAAGPNTFHNKTTYFYPKDAKN